MSPRSRTRFDSRSTAADVARGRDLRGRTLIVTGANTGIGFATAEALASTGARVVMACRSAVTGEAAAARMRKGNAAAQVEVRELDLASLASVKAFIAALPDERVHVVVCNAGVYLPRYEQTEDGFEKTVGVCHFGHFALVTGLLARLRAAGSARVVMVSSESHRAPPTLRFDRFPLPRERYRDLIAYGQAKLCNVLFANELSRRHGAEGVWANALHPGALVSTELTRDSLAGRALMAVVRPFTKSIPEAAATSVYCAIAPELEGVGGRYYRDCGEAPMSRGARDRAAAERLWELTERALRAEPRVRT